MKPKNNLHLEGDLDYNNHQRLSRSLPPPNKFGLEEGLELRLMEIITGCNQGISCQGVIEGG